MRVRVVLPCVVSLACVEPVERPPYAIVSPTPEAQDPAPPAPEPNDEDPDPEAPDCKLAKNTYFASLLDIYPEGRPLDFDWEGLITTNDAQTSLVRLSKNWGTEILSEGWESVDDVRVLSPSELAVVEGGELHVLRPDPDGSEVLDSYAVGEGAVIDPAAGGWIHVVADEAPITRIDVSTGVEEVLTEGPWSEPIGYHFPVDVVLTADEQTLYVLATPQRHGAEHVLRLYAFRWADGAWQAPEGLWEAPAPSVLAHDALAVDRCGNVFVLTGTVDGTSRLWYVPADGQDARVLKEVPHALHAIRWGNGHGSWQTDTLYTNGGDRVHYFRVQVDGTHLLAR